MSTKRAQKSKKTDVKKVEVKEVLQRPAGRAPEATVLTRHDHEMKTRMGRGFSLGEVEGAQVPMRLAASWGLSVDPRRGTVLEWNVESLKKWYSPQKPKKAEPEPVAEKLKSPEKKRPTRKKKEA